MDKDEVTKWLLKPGNNFCVMPYVHLAVESNGDIRPCCMGKPIEDAHGNTVNISGRSVTDAFNHPARINMVEQFNRNEQYSGCSVCWKNNTEYSPRVSFSTSAKIIDKTVEYVQGNRDHNLTWLEIKPGNRCNLRCRICGLHNSSSWAAETYKLNEPNIIYKHSETKEYMKKCDWIDEHAIWNNIDGLEHLSRIHIMGGSPS